MSTANHSARLERETLERLARSGCERVTECLAGDEEVLLQHPRIIELLYMNKSTRMSTADRLVRFGARHGLELDGIPAWREAATAIQEEPAPGPSEEPTLGDQLFRETREIAEMLEATEELARDGAPEAAVDRMEALGDSEGALAEDERGPAASHPKFTPLSKRLSSMTMSQKIRCAMLGTKGERMLLVRDPNRLVANAAVRSPLMQEDEVVLLARDRNISEDVLRIIGTSPTWLRSYPIKKTLAENPKTPIHVSSKLITQLRESDLKQIAKSKNVAGPVQEAARRYLDRRQT